MELENIKERTTAGRVAYVQNGGKLGKPKGSNESTFVAFLISLAISSIFFDLLDIRQPKISIP